MNYNPYFDYRINSSDMVNDLNIYTYPKNYQNAVRLIKEILCCERSDELFYHYLVNITPNEEAREILSDIRDDKIKHIKMFRTIYYQLTGQVLPPDENESFQKPQSFNEGLKQSLKRELATIVKYQQILFAMKNRVHFNMVTEIITNVFRHNVLYNLLLTLNHFA